MTHNMQSVILALQQFWAERGCLIWQPYYTQVGAGTMNPATFLRVLGPEPWRVAYVEPSVRPDDARYGENPNRMQQHYQFQVILKPDPGNAQDLYLQSLVSIGIDPTQHDIRFVEDKWEAPALGAWGLGWEVWLDGQEITQFTYFQQAAGRTLDPVSVEVTYGLERILIGLLSLDHFKDIPWNERLSYGDVQLKAEEEYAHYYLEFADVARLREIFALNEAEARSSLDHGLVLPAYDLLLRCSHTFNVMDSRGAVGVTERAGLFGRMRDLARAIGDAYLGQREGMGFPWMDRAEPIEPSPAVDEGAVPTTAQDFVLEIGTEELPAGDLAEALRSIEGQLPLLLAEVHLEHGGIEVVGTPRRLVASVKSLQAKATESEKLEKGPAETVAFDDRGNPTQAALAWARKFGINQDPAFLHALVTEIGGGKYLSRLVPAEGAPADRLLSKAVLPELLRRIGSKKTMRWIGIPGDSAEAVALRRTEFPRPIRWLLALHGRHVVPFGYAGLQAGATTRGLRFRGADSVHIASAGEFASRLKELGVIVDPAGRRQRIMAQAQKLAAGAGGNLAHDKDLLEEVANLVEAPQCLLGGFDSSFLDLPEEVLVAVMRKHQRYFPIRGRDGRLMPLFVAVANGDPEEVAPIRAGNEHVLRARFADAAYFLRRDRAQPLEAYRGRLASLTYHPELGSMLDKSERVERFTAKLAEDLDLTANDRSIAVRAAFLCKADLATAMVVEMTSLQGVMGRIYARDSGESEEVALAIYEHLLPRFSGDALPVSAAGTAVGVADRLDTLAGLFAVGMQPTGAGDPFGLRRTALGLIQILVARRQPADLERWLREAASGLPVEATGETIATCLEFILSREQALLLGVGHRHDIVEAVLKAQGRDPAGAAKAAAELAAASLAADWPPVLQAYARCARIVRGQAVDGAVDPRVFELAAERGLFEALKKSPHAAASVPELLEALRAMVPAITTFFDEVLVMSEDPAQRRNRLALVQRVVSLADGVVDLSRLEGF